MSVQRQSSFPEFVQRFDKHQRYQHLMLFVSMFFLFLTGFPIKYADSGFARTMVSLFGGFSNMFTVHLTAAVIMVVSGLYHIIWLVIHFKHNGPSWSMVPKLQDVKDAYHHALYLIGIRKERPKFDRYTYLEKFEYLAVIYGILLMGISGFILWFPDVAAMIMPRWVIQMFRIAHSNEALVALFAVAIGHFFWVHLNPDSFPTSPVWYNGKISRHHLQEEHPLEYERLSKIYDPAPMEEHSVKPAKGRLFMAVELILYLGLVAFLFATFIPQLLS